MKVNDYWRLAKISLKARKKATRSTVRGMSISLIVIVPVIFVLIVMYTSILPQLNENPETLYAVMPSAQVGYKLEASDKQMNGVNSGQFGFNSYLKDYNSVFEQLDEETLHFIQLKKQINSDHEGETKLYERIVLDGKKYPLRSQTQGYYASDTSIAVVDKTDLGLLVKSKYGVLGDNYNEGFSGDGASQVILSRRYLKKAGLTPDDVYGKTISIEVSDKASFYSSNVKIYDNDKEVQFIDHNLLKNFRVVGVMGSDKYEQEFGYYSVDIYTADIIVSTASYYGADEKVANAPTFSYENNNFVFRVEDSKKMNAMSEKYIFTGIFCYPAYSYWYPYDDASEITKIENHVYMYVPDKNSVNAYGKVTSFFNKIYPAYSAGSDLSKLDLQMMYASSSYQNFAMINMIMTYVMIGVGIFAGIILFAALVNLFNTIMHSVESRSNYLGVMRAIGARSNVIPKLYFFEVARLFSRAFAWIAVIGGGICVGLKILFDYLFADGLELMDVVIKISWASIPLTLVAIFAVLLIIGAVYAIGCSWRISRKPITEVLEG